MRHGFLIGILVLSGVVGAGCAKEEDKGGGGAGTPAPSAGTGGAAAGTGGAAAGTGGAAAGAGADMACTMGFVASGQTAECASCACSMCATEVGNLDALAADQRALADGVLDCARTNCCAGTACYCGATDIATCAAAMPPAGKCVAEVEAAAGGLKGLAMIAGPSMMPTTALGAPTALGRCLNGDGAMMAGKCPACTPTCN